jgi:3-oxoacyl-[acyl-carrier-protein] synthase II
MGEGAGILVLEEMKHALERGAKIYGEVVGYGSSGDAWHPMSPPEDGRGGLLAMTRAMGHRNVADIWMVNAHATSTQKGDRAEAAALRALFGKCPEQPHISALKSQMGHLMGAAGTVESALSLLCLKEKFVPRIMNLEKSEEHIENCGLRLKEADSEENRDWDGRKRLVLKNSFGMGGTNACLVFAEFNPETDVD